VSANSYTGTYRIHGTPIEAGTFTYTITTTGGCETVTTIGIIDVKPENTINIVAGNNSQTVCFKIIINRMKITTK
jgi:hypothetical protein